MKALHAPSQLVLGAAAYARGARLITQHRLWHYLLIPGVLSALLGAGLIYAVWTLSGGAGAWLAGLWPLAWGKAVVASVAQVLGGLAIGALGLIVFRQLVLVLASPFMSFLSETLERRLTNQPSRPFSTTGALHDLARSAALASRNVLREVLLVCLLLLLGLLPFLTPVVPLAVFAVQAYYAGFANMDYTLERHTSLTGSVAFVRAHRAYALGNGAVYLLLLLTGVGFFVALPLATAAATPDVLNQLATGRTPRGSVTA